MAGVSEPCLQGGMSLSLTFPSTLKALSAIALATAEIAGG